MDVKEQLKNIEKAFGKGSVMQLGDAPEQNLDVISTRSIAIDTALGVGGLPRGRVVEISGPNGSSKTSFSLHVIAEAQSKGYLAAFIDAEHAFDPSYARALGVDTDSLIFSQPDNGEQALEIADRLLDVDNLGVIVVDSVATLVPKAELDGEMGDNQMGLQARLMSKALRKLTGRIKNNNVLFIFINQIREKIGVMFGNPETSPGGNALKFYASVRIDLRASTQIKDGEDVLGHKVKVKIIKNKVAPPFKKAEVDIIYGKGYDTYGEVLDICVEKGIVKKAGSWYSYEGTNVGQGRVATIDMLRDNFDLFNELKKTVNKD